MKKLAMSVLLVGLGAAAMAAVMISGASLAQDAGGEPVPANVEGASKVGETKVEAKAEVAQPATAIEWKLVEVATPQTYPSITVDVNIPGGTLAAEVKKFSLKNALLEYSATIGKVIHIDDTTLSSLKELSVIVPHGVEYTAKDVVFDGLFEAKLCLQRAGNSLRVVHVS